MHKNILIIATSLRAHSNSDMLADEFARGAREAGHQVEQVSLKDKTLAFCKGCLACQKTQRCVIHDDANAIVERMKQADVIVFATPIYYYEMAGQMKTLLDRANPLFSDDYAFREMYLLATAADSNASAMDGALKGLQGWISCFDKARLRAVVRGTGLTEAGEAKTAYAALRQAYDAGKAC